MLWGKVTVRAMVKSARQALRVSNEESDAMEGTLYGVEHLLRPGAALGVSELKRFLARPTASMTRMLLSALAGAGLYRERIEQVEERLRVLETSDFAPPPLLTGDDLVARGLKPGPAFKRALDFVYDEQLEGRVTTREQALALGERRVRELEAQRSTSRPST
jgi:poly(A) polymerase